MHDTNLNVDLFWIRVKCVDVFDAVNVFIFSINTQCGTISTVTITNVYPMTLDHVPISLPRVFLFFFLAYDVK